MVNYREITLEDKNSMKILMDEVLGGLERKEFFIPYTEEEFEELFDKCKVISYGAFDDGKLIGTAQLYLQESCVRKLKEIINLKNDRVVELGGYLVSSEYRGKGIMKRLESILIEEAKKLNYEYILITVHPDNVASNMATRYTGAEVADTVYLGEYLRNIYLLKI